VRGRVRKWTWMVDDWPGHDEALGSTTGRGGGGGIPLRRVERLTNLPSAMTTSPTWSAWRRGRWTRPFLLIREDIIYWHQRRKKAAKMKSVIMAEDILLKTGCGETKVDEMPCSCGSAR